MIQSIDELVSASLKDFVTDVFSMPWKGREREAVSLYVFGHLIRYVNKNKFLTDPTQIIFESAVKQVANQTQLTNGEKSKNLVCKDIVLWPKPRMTCWDQTGKPTQAPAAIMEWKYDKPKVCEYDVKWLKEYSMSRRDFVGYAVCADPQKRYFQLSCTRVQNGMSEENWLLLK